MRFCLSSSRAKRGIQDKYFLGKANSTLRNYSEFASLTKYRAGFHVGIKPPLNDNVTASGTLHNTNILYQDNIMGKQIS